MINILAALFIFTAFLIKPIFGVVLLIVIIGVAVISKNKHSKSSGTKSLIKGIWIGLLEILVVLAIVIKKAIKK